jgi:hypothetical protein
VVSFLIEVEEVSKWGEGTSEKGDEWERSCAAFLAWRGAALWVLRGEGDGLGGRSLDHSSRVLKNLISFLRL